MSAEKQPRKYAAVAFPREYRMLFLELVDKIAFAAGKAEGAEHAPSNAAFGVVCSVLSDRLNMSPAWQKFKHQYQPSLWLQEKQKTATPIDQIAEELGIAL